jgi:serine/threonine-protein kinase ULK4
MSPELFQKQGVYTFYSDLWALGCVLYEMATGKPPFSSTSLKDILTQIMDVKNNQYCSYISRHRHQKLNI